MSPSLSTLILVAVKRRTIPAVAILALVACGGASGPGSHTGATPTATVDVSRLAADSSALSKSVPQTVSACDPSVMGFTPQACEASASASGDLLAAAAQNAGDAAVGGSAAAGRLRTVLDRCASTATSLAAGTGSAKLLDSQLSDCWIEAQRDYLAVASE